MLEYCEKYRQVAVQYYAATQPLPAMKTIVDDVFCLVAIISGSNIVMYCEGCRLHFPNFKEVHYQNIVLSKIFPSEKRLHSLIVSIQILVFPFVEYSPVNP